MVDRVFEYVGFVSWVFVGFGLLLGLRKYLWVFGLFCSCGVVLEMVVFILVLMLKLLLVSVIVGLKRLC